MSNFFGSKYALFTEDHGEGFLELRNDHVDLKFEFCD